MSEFKPGDIVLIKTGPSSGKSVTLIEKMSLPERKKLKLSNAKGEVWEIDKKLLWREGNIVKLREYCPEGAMMKIGEMQ